MERYSYTQTSRSRRSAVDWQQTAFDRFCQLKSLSFLLFIWLDPNCHILWQVYSENYAVALSVKFDTTTVKSCAAGLEMALSRHLVRTGFFNSSDNFSSDFLFSPFSTCKCDKLSLFVFFQDFKMNLRECNIPTPIHNQCQQFHCESLNHVNVIC